MLSTIHEALRSPERRRAYLDTLRTLDEAQTTPDVLIIGVICAALERAFETADRFLDSLADQRAAILADRDYAKLAMYCVDAVKPALYAPGAVAAVQCARILRLVEIADPEYRTLLVREPAPGPAPPRLHFDYAPQASPDTDADIFIRKYYTGPGSRLHDIGWRTATGLRRGGWNSRTIDLQHDLRFDAQALAQFTERRPGARRRHAFVDIFAFFGEGEEEQRRDFLRTLRGRYDSVVGMVFDAWLPELAAQLAEMLPELDLVWAVHPNAEAFRSPAVAAKTSFIPVMLGIDPDFVAALPPGEDRMSFAGSIELFNIHRMYWYLLSRQYGEFFTVTVSNQEDDGLSVEESQRRYLRRLARTSQCLSFSKRWNGYRALTGRAFEITALGRLLVQERSGDVSLYLTPGEHFAEFETLYDVLALSDDIRTRPDHYRRLAADGHSFHAERYGDAAITRHLSYVLG